MTGGTARHAVQLLVVALMAGAAPPVPAETLTEALIRSYQDNPEILAERATLRATDENVPEALANWRPSVFVTAEQGVIHDANRLDCGKAPMGLFGSPPDCSRRALNSFQNLWPQEYGLTVDQPIYRGGRTVAQTQQAYDLVRSERAHLADVEQTVFQTVVADYADVALEEAVLRLSTDYQHDLDRQLGGTEQRFHGGELTRTDVAEAAAAVAQAAVQRQTAETQLKLYRAAYQRDTGGAAGELTEIAFDPSLPASRAAAVALATDNDPPVAAARYAADAAVDNVDLVAGQGLPSLALEASISRSKETTASGYRTDTGQAVVELSVPIYEGGAISAQTRQAEETVTTRKHQLDDAQRTAIEAAGQSWDALEGTLGNIKSLERQVEADLTALEGARQEARTGDRGIFEIVIEAQNLFQARVNLASAQRDAVLERAAVAQAVGTLTAEGLALPVPRYDTEAYLESVAPPDPLGHKPPGPEPSEPAR